MPNALIVILILFFVLAVVTLVGHGIWVLLALIFGGGTRQNGKRKLRPCVYCGRMTPAGEQRCGWCGRELTGDLAAELDDLEAVARQLKRFRRAGALKPEAIENLLARVERYRLGLLRPAQGPIVAEVVREPAAPAKPQAAALPKPQAVALAKPQAAPPCATASTEAVKHAPLDVPARITPPRSAAPRRSWTEMLAGFMEERNIRWGELIGGLLIVGSSVALVLSLWDTLQQIRHFPFLVFVAVTSAIFGVGLYAQRRWKLESTSRGLLVIATLLVPLNFLALAGLLKGDWDIVTLMMVLIALGVFAWLISLAGEVLVAGGRWFQVLAVVGNAAAVPLLARWVGPESAERWCFAAGCLPAACFVLAVGGDLVQMRLASNHVELDAGRAAALLTLLGTALFALLVAMGILVAGASGVAAALDRLALPVAVAGVPILACGLTVMRGVARDKALGAWHVAGTTVALLGMAVMLAALGLAWPHPLAMVAVAALDCAALAVAAFYWRLPILHAGAIACATLAYLIVFHAVYSGLPLWAGEDDLGRQMVRLMVSAPSGTALVGLFLLFAAASELLARRGLHRHGAVYAGGSSVMAVAGLVLVTSYGLYRGEADALRAAILYVVYGSGSLALAARWRRAELVYLGLALLTAAPLWALWWHPGTHHIGPLWAAVLAGEALAMGLVAAAPTGTGLAGLFRIPLLHCAEIVATAAVALAVGTGWFDRLSIARDGSPAPIVAAICLAALYMLLAWQYRAPERAWVGSMIVLAGLVHTLVCNYTGLVPQPWLVALLSHSTLAVLAGTLLDLGKGLGKGTVPFSSDENRDSPQDENRDSPQDENWDSLPLERYADDIGRVFGRVLGESALLSSALAVAVLPLPLVSWTSTVPLAGCLFWLAAIWLAIAWRRRDAAIFAAHQVMLALAAAVATTAWLKRQDWVAAVPGDLFHPYSLQAYGVVLGLLALFWVAARIGLRDRRVGQGRAGAGGTSQTDQSQIGAFSDAIVKAATEVPPASRFACPTLQVGEKCGLAQKLLSPGWPTVDWLLRHALVWLQLLSVILYLLPGLAEELVQGFAVAPSLRTLQQAAWGGGAWAVLGILAAVFAAALWERWRNAELLSTLLVFVTVPCLVAGRFVADPAAASALRWGLAGCFLVGSIAVWNRRRLLALCRPCAIASTDYAPRLARATLLVTCALPVLALTVLAAVRQFMGAAPNSPAAGTLFHHLGPNVSYLVPLVLVLAGMVGYALRESSAGYAFSGGLVAELIVTLGYALSVVTDPTRTFGAGELVMLIQLATITAAAWALAWLEGRRWVNVWREPLLAAERAGALPKGTVPFSSDENWDSPPPITVPFSSDENWDSPPPIAVPFSSNENWDSPPPIVSTVLMNVQLGLGVAGNTLLIVAALTALALLPLDWQAWTVAAGRPLGWIALASVAGAGAYRLAQRRRRLHPNTVGLLGMAVLALLACTVRWVLPQWGYDAAWGYRTLMLGWAAYAMFIVSATWWVATVRTLPDAQGPPQVLVRAAAVWVCVAGVLAVLLGLKAALLHPQYEDLLWSAAAIAVASGAGATMAVWRRQEGWAFSAALGTNLAASLVVWYFHRDAGGLDVWWLRLVQANVIASAAVALLWLAARRRLYQLRELQLRHSPLLALQTALPVLGNLLLLVFPVLWLLQVPAYLPGAMTPLADAPGWIGLLLAAAAAAWYLRQVFPGSLIQVVGGLALGIGVLAACGAGHLNPGPHVNAWLVYHILTTAWAVAGVTVLGIGIARSAPRALVQGWVTIIGMMTIGLAVLHVHVDTDAWWSIRAVLSAGFVAGLLAMWLRLPAYVFISGLLVNVAGTIAWVAWGSPTVVGFVQANVFCLAVGSAVWTLLRPMHPAGVPHLEIERRPMRFSHLAAVLGVGALAATAAVGLAADLSGRRDFHLDVGRLDWIVLGATTATAAICLWDRTARFVLPALYFLGLAAVTLGICAFDLGPRGSYWKATCDSAAPVLVAAVLGWVLPRVRPVWRALRIPDQPDRWPVTWFFWSQAVVAAASAALVAWISIDFAFDGVGDEIALFGRSGRLAGNAGALMLLGAVILMAWQTKAAWRLRWQSAAFAAGMLMTCSLTWSRLDAAVGTPTGDAPWLHRSVILMVAAAMMTLLSGFGLRLFLPGKSDWLPAGRRVTPFVGGLAILTLVAVLAQEAWLFSPATGTPMTDLAIVVVGIALLGLIVASLGFAIVPAWEPLGLSDRGRTAYVYVAEVLVVMIGLHVRLTLPELFKLGIIKHYWMLVAMGVAFVGAGLSELFRRRKMPVLSEPLERTALLLPLAAAVGFWFMDDTTRSTGFVGDASPALWFLMGLFYGVMAVGRGSVGLAAMGILTGNVGLWVLWHRCGLDFFDRPQLWLIPVALAVLVAEHLDRRRLSESQRTALRYLALSVIYVSSTTEFWREIGQSPVLPLVTILLAVLGVLAGILLRVRSFLYLGVTFLAVVIGRMIVYAAFEQKQIWVFWTCCILLGAAIIALFAVFEKRRNDVLAAVERFKAWEK